MKDLISRQALCEYALNQKDKSITPNDIMRFPSAQPERNTDNMDKLIKASDAVDIVAKHSALYGDGEISTDDGEALLYGIMSEIMNLPSAEPKQRWIPCSERLPENIRPVIVTWKNNDPASYYQYIVGKHFIGSAHYCNGKWFWYSSTCEDYLAEYGKSDVDEVDEAIEIIAWMPLPEPWKEESDG